MRLAAMQPYFLPYLGYFSLIAAADQFVVFDPVQYIRHGWINRNRVLKPGLRECQYINVPLVKHSRETLIRDISIANQLDWRQKLQGKIQHYRKRAPFYDQADEILQRCLAVQTESIVTLNVHCLSVVCDALGIDFHYILFDDIQPRFEPPDHPGGWAPRIANALQATSYINPVDGRGIFRPEEFEDVGVELLFLSNALSPYSQRNDQFIPGLSILDVLMFNSLDDTRKRIEQDVTITS